jgi:hypothetical protein
MQPPASPIATSATPRAPATAKQAGVLGSAQAQRRSPAFVRPQTSRLPNANWVTPRSCGAAWTPGPWFLLRIVEDSVQLNGVVPQH